MTTTKITMIEDLPAVQLTWELLDALGAKVDDDIEISVSDRTLIIRTGSEAERQAKMNQIFEDLLVERDSAYRKLAEGVK